MNLLDFGVTPLWRVWETVRAEAAEDGVELAESELIGLAPLAAFLDVADHAGAPSRRPRSRSGSRRPPRSCGCATSARCMALELRLAAAAAGGRVTEPRDEPPGRSRAGAPGRTAGPARSSGAAEVVTMAGGSARGRDQGDDRRCSRRRAAIRTRPTPGRRLLGGPDRSRSAPRPTSSGASRPRATPLERFARLDAGRRHGDARARRPAHPPAVRAAPARASSCSASAAPATSRSWPPAAGSSRRSPRRARPRPTTLAAHGRRWLDEMLGHGVTTIEAKSGYGLDLATELRLLEVAHRLGEEGPIDVVPTWLGAHAVPPEFRGRPDGDGGVRPLPARGAAARASPPRAGRASADVFCEEGVFSADQSRRILEAAAALRAAAAAPRRRAGAERRRGARRGDRGAVGRPPRDPVRGRASTRWPRPRRTDQPVVATLLPATTWFLMKDHHAPARAVHRARRARSRSGPTSTRARRRRRACRWR